MNIAKHKCMHYLFIKKLKLIKSFNTLLLIPFQSMTLHSILVFDSIVCCDFGFPLGSIKYGHKWFLCM